MIDSHTCVFNNGKFYVFGGNDSTIGFETIRVYELKVSPISMTIDIEVVFEDEFNKEEKVVPEPRRDHVCVMMKHHKLGAHLVIHGGRSKINFDKVLTDAWAYSIQDGEWKHLGDFLPLASHACCVGVKSTRVFLFGGRSEIDKYSNKIYSLDVDLEAEKASFNEIPCMGGRSGMISPREKTSSIIYKNRMIVFGGWSEGESKNDLWVVNLLDKVKRSENSNEEAHVWERVAKGLARPRYGHGFGVDQRKTLFVVGGKTINNTSDVLKFNLEEILKFASLVKTK